MACQWRRDAYTLYNLTQNANRADDEKSYSKLSIPERERIKKIKGSNLFTERLEIDPDGECVTASVLVAFTFHKIKIKS